MTLRPLLASLLLAMAGSTAAAPRIIVGDVSAMSGRPGATVELIILNGDAHPVAPPERVAATLSTGDAPRPVTLNRTEQAVATVPAGGFAILRYAIVGAAVPAGATLALTSGGPAIPATPSAPAPTALVAAKPERGNAFLGNISTYAPIYAVYGPGTDSEARLQLSLKYQLFGDPGAVGPGSPWQNGIHLGFTQRMFWDLGAESSPFRSIDFLPEAFYLLPARPVTGRVTIGGQAGFRHESNGRDGLDSRSLNTVYVQPVATLMAGDYTLSIGPRLWFYAGSLEDNPDIRRYRGNSGLFAEIGKDDGFRLTTNSRFNFGSGKGAIDAELSYPLDRIVESDLNLYLFGQAFAGYGENLFDYDRRVTRIRFGIGIVR